MLHLQHATLPSPTHTHTEGEWERGREAAKPPTEMAVSQQQRNHWVGCTQRTQPTLTHPPNTLPPHCPPQHPSRVSVRSDCALTLKLMLHIFSFSVYSPFFRWVSLALSSAPPTLLHPPPSLHTSTEKRNVLYALYTCRACWFPLGI